GLPATDPLAGGRAPLVHRQAASQLPAGRAYCTRAAKGGDRLRAPGSDGGVLLQLPRAVWRFLWLQLRLQCLGCTSPGAYALDGRVAKISAGPNTGNRLRSDGAT